MQQLAPRPQRPAALTPHPFPARRRGEAHAGFTLVELLTVIVIIGILVGLVTAAAIRVRGSVKTATIRFEIGKFESILGPYSAEYGELPPDFAGVNHTNAVVRDAARQRVLSHLRTRFPNYSPTRDTSKTNWENFRQDVLDGSGLDVLTLDPASALVFWLGGIPDRSSGTTMPAGFHTNPRNPFQIGGPRTEPAFPFEPRRLIDRVGTGWRQYYPEYAPAAPYVYFRAWPGGAYEPQVQMWPPPSASGFVEDDGDNNPSTLLYARVRPYFDDRVNTFANPRTCQIISAGIDELWGGIPEDANPAGTSDPPVAAPHFPSTINRRGIGHYDNITNFTKGTLQDET